MNQCEAELLAENAALKIRVAWLEGELGLTVDTGAQKACRQILGVTPAESYVLCALANAYPRPVQRWALEEGAPGYKHERHTTFAKVLVCRLRRKFGDASIFTTERGYRLGEALCARVLAAFAITLEAVG